MGFAASQARFLSLTARLADNEFEAGQISQERVDVLHQMQRYSDEYDAATNNQFLTANVFDMATNANSKVALTYDIIGKDPLEGGLGMNLITASGKIVVPSEEEMHKQIEERQELVSKGLSTEPLSAADFFIFEDVVQPSALQKNLEDGNFFFAPKTKNEQTGEYDKKSIAMLNNVSSDYDKSDDAAAKARYDKKMNIAEAKDAMLEMRLSQLESSHKAIETEMESVQKIVDDNVESSFKTFG